jgi:hypothetical protein
MRILAQAGGTSEDMTQLMHLALLFVGAMVGGLLLLWFVRRMMRAPRRYPDAESILREDLAGFPPAPGTPGPRRLLVSEVPVRLRLVVVAPVGKRTDINADEIEAILNQFLRGLGDLARHDKPRMRLWPPQLSNRGFAPTFHRLVSVPDAPGQPSHWVLLAGQVKAGNWPLLLGLACWADQPTTLGRLSLEPVQWASTVRIGSAEG